MDLVPPPKPSLTRACDNCRRRKIKCSRELPCDKCQPLLLCSYSDNIRRKGPKFRNVYPLAPAHPLSTRNETTQEQLYPDHDNYTDSSAYRISSPTSSAFPATDTKYGSHDIPDTLSQLPPAELLSLPDSMEPMVESASGHALPHSGRLSPQILLAHVNIYLKYLFPIMPVVRGEEVRLDSQQPEGLSSKRYAFLVSLCAATHIQLKLDGENPVGNAVGLQSLGDDYSLVSGEELLSEAVRARQECDPIEEICLETLLTSFFLFACFGNMDKQNHSWFYLCQSTSMVFTLGLHCERTYVEFNVEEAEERRRVFWLLFITERRVYPLIPLESILTVLNSGYALQQSKPVILRSSIRKPQVLGSEDPILAYGFINLINIFEKLTANLYDWVSAGGGDGLLERPPTSVILSSLSKPISLDGVLEIQQIDILVTQQWLQAAMWKLSMFHATQLGSHDDFMLPFHLPVLAGKAVMSVIGTASQGAVNAHGIGMEQKLFDIGISVADVTRSLGSNAVHRLAESSIDPRELLWGILHTLSQIRGSPSYLLPSLLERCKTVLGLDCTITMGNFLPILDASIPDQLSSEDGWEMLAANRDPYEIPQVEDDQDESVAYMSGGLEGGENISFQDCLLS